MKGAVPYVNSRERRRSSLLLFLIGLFASTRIYFGGIVAISELLILVLSPFVLYYDYQDLKHDGFMPVIQLLFGSMVMLIVGSALNHCLVYYRVILNKEAMMYSLIAHIVVFHRLLRGNIRGLRWLLVGFFLSTIIKIWWFNPQVVEFGVGSVGVEDSEMEDVFGDPLFWSSRLKALVSMVAGGWYPSMPLPVLIVATLAIVGFVATHTESGRGSMMTLLVGVMFIVIGRKRQQTIYNFTRRFAVIILLMVVALAGIKMIYGFAAVNGVLGEKAHSKYIKQTINGTSALSILMAGRSEFFVQARGALDRPLLGYGILAIDEKGYGRDYILKYGSSQDYANYEKRILALPIGMNVTFPRHSHIMTFWMDSGLVGFILWAYILVLIFRYFSKYAPACPYLFGYMSLSLTAYVWSILFNPVVSRSSDALPIVLLLLVRAIYNKRISLDQTECGFEQRHIR